MVREEEIFSADLMLIASVHDGGFCYIQTSSLDGEKNLKKRTRPKDLKESRCPNGLDPEKFSNLIADVVSELPNAELYQYSGKATLCNENIALTANQLLLKGSKLKNTEWVVGFAVFTGDDTKLMMNS